MSENLKQLMIGLPKAQQMRLLAHWTIDYLSLADATLPDLEQAMDALLHERFEQAQEALLAFRDRPPPHPKD